MTQITTGIRAMLSSPRVYDLSQKIMGADAIRREFVAEFIRPQPTMKVLDIGCGTAEILDHLPDEVVYWGFDISRHYIDSAKQRYAKRNASFECGLLDRKSLASLPKFDVVIALGVLHHLDDGDAQGLFDLASEATLPGGRAVTIDPVFVDGQNPFARLLIANDRGRNIRDPDGYRRLPRSTHWQVAGEVRHRAWIPYTHWIMECQS